MSLDNFAEQLNPIKSRASSLVERATQQASSIDDRLVDGISNSVSARLDVWLNQHPVIAWLAHHPLVSVITALIALILLVRLMLTIYRAIASTIDRAWLAILRSPMWLIKIIFGWQPKPKVNNSQNTTITNYEITQDSLQLAEIITRLDQIQQQQQQIMQDLAELKQQPLTIKSPSLKQIESKK